MENKSMTKKDFSINISVLRIIATLSVVWLHTCSTITDNPDLFIMNNMQKNFFNSGYQMMYWAVPVFFMISGALLLNPQKDIKVKDCIKKYSSRILLALIIFGIPFAMLKLIMETGSFNIRIIPQSIKAVAENNSLGHLWYLYTLLGLYM
ncbi:MAG: acyltransferase, partial [Ruminococcus sp.]|nr:acyltransferase [Ruminococcus sp.]